jgi:YD repeat-containing protein
MDYFPDREANGQGGWLSAMVDALGRETRFDYDKAGRMTSVTLHDGRKVGYT